MVTRIKETELASVEVRRYAEFLAAAPGESGSGIPLFSQKVLGGFYGQRAAARTVPIDQLVIEVEHPDEEATLERLRVAIIEQFKK